MRTLVDTGVQFRPWCRSLPLKLTQSRLFVGAPHCWVLIPAAACVGSEEVWSASRAPCHLASCPGTSDAWPFPADPARVPRSVCSLAKEIDTCGTQVIRGPAGRWDSVKVRGGCSQRGPRSGLSPCPLSPSSTCEMRPAGAHLAGGSLASKGWGWCWLSRWCDRNRVGVWLFVLQILT